MEILDALFVYHLVEDHRIAWHGRYHSHQAGEYELHVFLEGDGLFLSGGTKYGITPCRVFLTPPHEFHSIIPTAGGKKPISYYAILFTDGAGFLPSTRRPLAADQTCRLYFEDIVRLFRSDDAALQEAAAHLLHSLLLRFFAAGESAIRPSAAEKAVQRKLEISVHVEKALAIMQNAVREKMLTEDIAALVGLSCEHFVRVFHKEVKLPPHQYFLRLKIEGASGMLISTGKTIKEIADEFGFDNQFHFSRVFKHCTGMPPLHYRRAYLQMDDFVPPTS